ncbi:hypothetical protein AXW67_17755 [Bradyrhizobium neotropicale]|uniref:Uncharacterized protein n=1 Tax=Bradyrhizobium neotropicale TaxID=1497615 RepID=A0A176Z397_9BRAD|nr:hypothetical protein AXW67_17755 [Bradyrhizobium neotropicale]
MMDWSTMTHNLFVEVTKDTATLYVSDRDAILFLVDDTNPIEMTRIRLNGVLGGWVTGFVFPGSLLLEREVGSQTLVITSAYA